LQRDKVPRPAPDRIAVVAEVTATTAVGFVVFAASHDGVVGVDDQRAGTGRHVGDGSEALRRPDDRWCLVRRLGRGVNCVARFGADLLELGACVPFCDDADEDLHVCARKPLVHESPNGSFDARPVDGRETAVEIGDGDPDHGLFVGSV
jgi:hypothetical protein